MKSAPPNHSLSHSFPMEKISCETDLDEWEVLSDDGFLDFKREDSITKGFLSRELAFEFDPKGGHGVDVNYFICPSPRPPDPRQSRALNRRDGVVPVPIQLEPTVVKAPCLELEKVKDISEVPTVEVSILAPTVQKQIKEPPPAAAAAAADQIFFKKMKENEFVDMKLDSPRSSSTNSRAPKPQIEVGSMPFEEKEAACDDGEHAEHRPSKMPIEEEDGAGLNIWKWKTSGIGALCSLGLAAATICVFVFSGHQRPKQQGRNPKFHFEIYADDQRIKQMVHQATRLNQALSAVRGVPLVRAHITFGGYYDGANAVLES